MLNSKNKSRINSENDIEQIKNCQVLWLVAASERST